MLRRRRHLQPPFPASSLPPLFSIRPLSRSPEPEQEPEPELEHRREAPSLSFAALLQPCADADAMAGIVLRHHNPFHAMESPLQLSGTLAPSPHLVLQTLLRLRHASKVALGFFVWARDHAGHRHGADAYDLMVDALGRVHQFDVAWQLVVEMAQLGVGPSPRTFAVLVRRYAAAGLTRMAVRAFDDMEAFVERPADGADFNVLLDTLCKYGHVKVATEVFNKRKSSFLPDEKTYTILMYGWCKINRPEMAERFLKEMCDRGLEPNVVSYNVLLNGICRRPSLHPESRFERTVQAARDLFEEMRNRGIEPDVSSYSILLHVYSRAHKPELSLSMLRMMREKGICPNVVTYTSVIKCLASCGRLEEAEALLDEMTSNGVCPSAATYNCFFKEYRGRKDVDGAMKLYGKMKGVGSLSNPDMHTYNILVGMFSKFNRMELVRELWNDMSERGIGPDMDSYTLLIHELCGKQQWREACQFFMEMIEKGFLPQKVTFETLYRGLIQADMLRTWRRLKKKIEEESLKFGAEFQDYHFKPYKR